jgi:hypothetical protein
VTQPLPFRKKTVIERADVTAEQLGLQLWCEDEGGPYQSLPHPGPSWQPEVCWLLGTSVRKVDGFGFDCSIFLAALVLHR